MNLFSNIILSAASASSSLNSLKNLKEGDPLIPDVIMIPLVVVGLIVFIVYRAVKANKKDE